MCFMDTHAHYTADLRLSDNRYVTLYQTEHYQTDISGALKSDKCFMSNDNQENEYTNSL